MRPIKFRAWDKRKNEMWDWYSPANGFGRTGVFVSFEGAVKYGWELMQFTGLLDKNGKEIYDGDVVSKGKDSQIYTVAWRGHSYGLMRKIDYGQVWSGFVSTASTLEVIGNLYENPELINA